MAVMIDLRGSSVNMENLLRIHSGSANRLKETVQSEQREHNVWAASTWLVTLGITKKAY